MVTWYKAEDGWRVEDVCHSANDHIVTALILFDIRKPEALQVLDSAGFLAHLGIELLLKAALLHLVGKFPDKHNLHNLSNRLSVEGYVLNLSDEDSKTFDFLSEFHELRYHDPQGLPHIYQEDRHRIYQLFLSLRKNLPEEISKAIDDIDHLEKSGRDLLARKQTE